MMPSPSPRIPPLPPDEWPPEIRELLLADLGDESPLGASRLADLNLFTTAARHSRPFRPWVLLGRSLVMHGQLPTADRELIVLRTAWNCSSRYEWGQHVAIGLDVGLDRATIDRVPSGPDAVGWDARTSLLLRAADELHADARISDATWAGLARELDEQALIELPMLVGYYVLVAFILNSLGIEPERGLEPLPGT